MSIHVQLTDEARKKLEVQQRNSTIASVVITALTITLFGLLLYFIFLKPILIEVPTMVTYQSNKEVENEVSKKKPQKQVVKKPPAASSNISKVIASTAPSNVSIPVPDVNVSEPSLEFGDSDDFGEGWGEEESFSGGGATFFGQETKGNNICFVIDYSQSMNSGAREELMREEMKTSLKTLSNGMNYSLIFFAGPVWVGGDEYTVEGDPKAQTGSFKGTDGKTYDWAKKKGWKGKSRKGEWVTVSKDALKASQKHVKDTPLVYGTNWLPPLEMAMDLKPTPDVINFMTDGSTGNPSKTLAIIEEISKKAKRAGTVINCVALMEPKAKEGMMQLAKENGGQFTMVEKNGKSTIIPLD